MANTRRSSIDCDQVAHCSAVASDTLIVGDAAGEAGREAGGTGWFKGTGLTDAHL